MSERESEREREREREEEEEEEEVERSAARHTKPSEHPHNDLNKMPLRLLQKPPCGRSIKTYVWLVPSRRHTQHTRITDDVTCSLASGETYVNTTRGIRLGDSG